MKPRCSHKNHGLTMVELLVVIIVLFVVAVVLFPALNQRTHPNRAAPLNCINNLKQVGLAYHIWASDHGDKFPMEISIKNGGTMELAAKENAVATFQIISNELSTPKILICRQDKNHVVATNFESGLSAKNISYFFGLDANTNFPKGFLSGDDNFESGDTLIKSGLLELSTNSTIAWASGRHISYKEHFWTPTHKIGNICLTDGSVQENNSIELQEAFQKTGFATNRLAIP